MSQFAIGASAITYGASMISAILPPMANKAMDIIKDKAMDFMVVDKVDGIVNIEREISNLQTTLRIIEGIVQEAEEKQIDNVYIQNWLCDLVDIGYDARDVLDDFFTFSSCITTEGVSKSVKFISSRISFMLSYFNIDGPSSDTPKLPVTILNQLAKDIKGVRERFDEKIKNSEKFATLKFVVGGSESVRIYRRPEVGPFINQQRDNLFLGREVVKGEIMEKIVHPNDNHVHVVPIWGMGGIGKTTLAQSIYNDERVKEEDYPSKNRRWLCVGEKKFSATDVIMKIIKESGTNNVEDLQKKLVEKLRGNRFLIVLDDVWNVDNNEWNLLFNPLTSVGKGGFIIITTRTSEVITAINTQTPDDLKPLSKEDSWSIFESRAYINGKSDSTPDLKDIGQKIVEKLKGLPLVLEVVGCSLLNEDSKTWKNFLNSNYHDVMSALRWSYSHLPTHLKMCFTYCSLFPKDHLFYEKVLVQMWMAHDLIKKEEQKRPEDVGSQYFKQLVNASLLQCVDGKYVMHDMIHDLALSVSNGEFATTNSKIDQMEKVRHITITPEDYSKIPRLCKIEKLLTLYTICSDRNWCDYSVLYDVFKQMKSIRVLVLSIKCIFKIRECISGLIHLRYLDIKEITVPDCMNELRHHEYLDASKTNVKSLPNSLCHLYNLEMLAAPLNAELPKGIVNIPCLRHVRANLSTCEGVGKLTSLQELSSILVCKGDNIRELGHMQQLRGKLTINGLENVISLEDAAGALMEKQTLMDQLELVFNQHFAESTISEEVLNALGCPPNLTNLLIMGYDGLKPPRWMEDGKLVAKLQTLELSDCPQLESLPPLGELTSLKHLSLKLLHGVKRLGKEFYGNLTNNKVFFPSLESLYFGDMEGWKEWDDKFVIKNSGVSFFPCLTSLEINHCPKIVLVLPTVKNGTSKRKREDRHPTMGAIYFMKSLSRLKICYCPGLKRLQLDILVSLKDLDISHCNSLILIKSEVESTTERLQISYCEHLEKMDIKRLPSLKHLDLRGCHKLVSIPCLVGIEFLYLTHCKSLTTLDVRGLDSLEYLLISDCPVLELTFEEGSSSSSSSSGNSVAVRLHICTDKKQIFIKLFQHEFVYLETLSIESVTELENFCETEENKFCELRSLKSLCISSCEDLKSLPEDFHKLSSLNSLQIVSCPQLQSLPPSLGKLSSLKKLHIKSCPKLQSLPPDFHKLSSLNSLEIVNCLQLQSLPSDFHKLSSLNCLEIVNCLQLQSLPPDFHKLSSLNSLQIVSCPQLQSLPPSLGKLSSLKKLHIKSCPKLQSLPPDFHKFSSLNCLEIVNCLRLQSLLPDFHKLTSLDSLVIANCPQVQSLTRSINSLVISYCQPLRERCKRELGLDWHKIKHIRNIRLYGEHNFINVVDGTVIDCDYYDGEDDDDDLDLDEEEDEDEDEEEILRDPDYDNDDQGEGDDHSDDDNDDQGEDDDHSDDALFGLFNFLT